MDIKRKYIFIIAFLLLFYGLAFEYKINLNQYTSILKEYSYFSIQVLSLNILSLNFLFKNNSKFLLVTLFINIIRIICFFIVKSRLGIYFSLNIYSIFLIGLFLLIYQFIYFAKNKKLY